MAEALVTWSSGDTLVAAVDTAGLVTAVGGGTTTVTAAAGDVSDTVVVTVMQSVGSVVISPSEGVIAVGDTLRLAGEAFDENGHRVDGAVFTWSSSDAGVARVDETGLVSGVAEGTVRITAAAGDVSGIAGITVENPDRAALVALYEATDGPNWVDNTNWLTDAPLGDWYGVDTNVSGRVVRLDLSGQWDYDARVWLRHGLSGPIPSAIGNLSSLTLLRLTANELAGAIPQELGKLVSLNGLFLDSNRLSSPIPAELGNLANLTELDFSSNELSGPIPAALGNLASLTEFDLSNNRVSGPIPPELGTHLPV